MATSFSGTGGAAAVAPALAVAAKPKANWVDRMISEDAINFHSKQATTWEANQSDPTFSVRLEVLQSLLADRNLSGQQWLDAGCGTGTLARWLASQRGCRVLGVDGSAEMIANCRQIAGTEFRTVRDICDLELSDGNFDGVLCSSVIEYTPSPEAALRELRRVLKKGGLLLVSAPNANPMVRLPQFAIHAITKLIGKPLLSYLEYSSWSYSPASLSKLLEHCSFMPGGYRKYGKVRFFNIRFNIEGTTIMFLAQAA
jgi:ubiquinone/menaquinone biosynthesis C-methylase UbiE